MANVLIVDDDIMALDAIAVVVEAEGHRAWRTGNSAEAMALLTGPGHFDLAIVDLVLRGSSGVELVKQIRSRFPSLPVVAISGYVTEDSTSVLDTLRKLGVTQVLRKPAEGAVLSEAIKTALGRAT